MGSARLGAFVWPGLILAGLALGLSVLAAWPESTTRVARLPYGESQPKTPRTEARAARVTLATQPERANESAAAADSGSADETARVLAGADPDAVTEEYDPADGPAPVRSETELADDYVQESPEELGAEPLPGADVTRSPPVAG